MKASPKITPHELIESARDLSNTTTIEGEKLKLENPSLAEETERSNSDVAAVYKEPCKFAVLSEDEKPADAADRLFEIAIDRPVIGSLPSQVHRAMKAWIERNQLLKLRDESVLKFCKWLVGNGEYDSVNLSLSRKPNWDSFTSWALLMNPPAPG